MDCNRIISKLAKATIQADGSAPRIKWLKNSAAGGNGVAFVVKSPKKIPPIIVHHNRPLTEMRETASGFNDTEPWPGERVLPS